MDKFLKINKLTLIQGLFVVLAIVFFIYGKMVTNFNAQLVGVMFLWANNLTFCFKNFGQRIVFFFFNITMFVFLLSRPFISMFRNRAWWHWGSSAANFSMNALFLTLLCLLIGAIIISHTRLKDFDSTLKAAKNVNFQRMLALISLAFYFVAVATSTFLDVEKLMFVRRSTYEQFYASFSSSLPTYIQIIGTMTPYVICIYLACMPKKGMSYFVLGSYVVSAVPTMIMGQRSPMILRIVCVSLFYHPGLLERSSKMDW